MAGAGVNRMDRATALASLAEREFDVLVVGGGITGCGIALDAAARRLSVALVEKDDFASGTSSKSTKLVHGGLRYLNAKEYRLVYENLAERQRLLRNASHLVEPLPFVIPVFGKGGVANRAYVKGVDTALWLYDLTGGLRIGKRHRRIGKQRALAHLPTLDADRLVDAFLYYDARADDARLTLAVLRTAVLDHGAVAVNRARVTSLVEQEGRIRGAVLDGPGCEGLRVRARCVVNAAGVWADEVRGMGDGGVAAAIRPAKGVHVTVPAARLPCDAAIVLTVPKDKRSITVLPWGEHTYLGSTDTPYDGPLDDPAVTAEDVSYLLDAANAWLSTPLTPADVASAWAGLRPLLAAPGASERTADLSRRHAIEVSARGLVSVTGGKLTTYRRMAADAVGEVVRLLGRGPRRSPTARLRLRGAGIRGTDHLTRRYGTEALEVRSLIRTDPSLADPLVAGLPYLRAEAVYAVRAEMATTLEDVLARRTRALLLDEAATRAAVEDVAGLLAPELGWSDAETAAHVAAFHDAAAAGTAALR